MLADAMVDEGADVEVLGGIDEAPSTTGPARLPMTGATVWLLMLMGGLLTVAGWRLTRSRS